MKLIAIIIALTCLFLAVQPASASLSVRVRHWDGSCVADAEVVIRQGLEEVGRITTNTLGYGCTRLYCYGDFTVDCNGYESKAVHNLKPGKSRHVDFVVMRVNGGRLPQSEVGT